MTEPWPTQQNPSHYHRVTSSEIPLSSSFGNFISLTNGHKKGSNDGEPDAMVAHDTHITSTKSLCETLSRHKLGSGVALRPEEALRAEFSVHSLMLHVNAQNDTDIRDQALTASLSTFSYRTSPEVTLRGSAITENHLTTARLDMLYLSV